MIETKVCRGLRHIQTQQGSEQPQKHILNDTLLIASLASGLLDVRACTSVCEVWRVGALPYLSRSVGSHSGYANRLSKTSETTRHMTFPLSSIPLYNLRTFQIR